MPEDGGGLGPHLMGHIEATSAGSARGPRGFRTSRGSRCGVRDRPGGHGAEPVAPPLEGTAGQFGPAGAGPGEHLRPVGGRPVHPQPGQREKQPPGAALAPAQGADGEAAQDLDQAGDPGGPFQMAHVRLGGPHQQRTVLRTRGADHLGQRRRLDGVADGRAGAVQFDVLHLVGADPGRRVRLAEHLRLGGPAGGGETVPAAVVVDRAAAQHPMDPVAVGERAGEGFEQYETAALAPDEAVGPGVEGEAPAVGREPAEGCGAERAVVREIEVDTARERGVAFAVAQALAGRVHRDQRGRLARVHHHAGAAGAQQIREPVGDHAALKIGQGVVGDRGVAVPPQQSGVVVVDGADEHPRTPVGDPGRCEARVLQGFPAQFEHQPLLGVHGAGLARRYAEEVGVEVVDAVQEGAEFHPRFGSGP